nr:MAG TPA: hypothetical protein [Caudoviricetes sp.]
MRENFPHDRFRAGGLPLLEERTHTPRNKKEGQPSGTKERIVFLLSLIPNGPRRGIYYYALRHNKQIVCTSLP